MNGRIVIVVLFVLFFNQLSIAQNDADALRYSMINWGSTARSFGMGNSFSALGADPSVMATNPGGLGFYRRSEFTFSPTFTGRSTTGEILNNEVKKNNLKFNFSNLAFVWAFPKDDDKNDWKGWSFGIGYNRLNDFSSKSFTEGTNSRNSLLDTYLKQIVDDQTAPSNFGEQYPFDINLAWETFLIDTVSDSNGLYIYSAIPAGGARQRRTVETKGGMGEWDFSFGTNYKDKVYFGATLGLVSVSYKENITWEETDVNNTIASDVLLPNFKSYKYTTNLNTDGSGFNLKFGIIYKPNDVLRLGAAIHTPTFLTLTDNYKSSITSNFEGGATYTQVSPDFLPFDYNINTPFRAIGSIGLVLGKNGIIGAEYEYLNYSSSDISPKDKQFESSFVDANNTIKRRYTASHNFRLGGELRYEALRFRFGGSYYGTPFSNGYNDKETDQSRVCVNGGIGVREKNFYFDASYGYTISGSYEGVYSYENENIGVKQTTINNRVMVTLGFNY